MTNTEIQKQLNKKNDLNEKTQILITKPTKPILVRSNYDYSVRVQEINSEPSLTVQDEKDACDINRILERFQKTGVLEHIKNNPPRYGDFSDVPNYQESLNKVIQAKEMFMELPATIREKFLNDPLKFLEFANNPKNADAMVDLGLAKPRKTAVIEQTATSEAQATSTQKESLKSDSGLK